MADHRKTWLTILIRGLRKRCPQCGIGSVFAGWHNVDESCRHCGLDLDTREGDTWAFMYITTAGLTGFFFVGMLLIKPESIAIAQFILLPLSLAVIVGSLPLRKSIAIALDYYAELRWDNHRNRSLQYGPAPRPDAADRDDRP